MSSRIARGWLVAALGACGCANVHVHKVPVEDRACGEDKHVKGFRYYMSRPYILVKERVPLGSRAVPTRLVQAKNPKKADQPLYALLALTCEPKSKKAVYDLTGKEQPDWVGYEWEVVSKTPLPKVMPKPEEPKLMPLAQLAPPQAGMPPGPIILPKPAATGPRDENPPAQPLANTVFQVVMLPDFEEQYAIKNCNVLAQTKYDFSFSNGMLVEAAGSYNATVVPVKILQTVQQLLGTQAQLKKEELESLPIPKAPEGTGAKDELDPTSVYYVLHETFIEPGLYRVQKSWERQAAAAEQGVGPEQVPGLLTDLGLPVQAEVSVLTAAEYQAYRKAVVPAR